MKIPGFDSRGRRRERGGGLPCKLQINSFPPTQTTHHLPPWGQRMGFQLPSLRWHIEINTHFSYSRWGRSQTSHGYCVDISSTLRVVNIFLTIKRAGVVFVIFRWCFREMGKKLLRHCEI